ncbi:pyridoxal phosphate-dependent transferase [Halteromyces radiatus]|uniref:pyridoxal phosphate-dependent transferase n=1 Tax=Halteromyces radiatus TaxID=101107 RepID=UPI002220EEC0|nr:pyridoxal phosphate-dependent transferase [Halteromyces radiatus]KAI8078732.1 pyridoxal phosphate-dependent transferase [Halteromyces radiatus]
MTDIHQLGDKELLDRNTANSLDAQDPLSKFRQEFAIPTRGDVAGDKPIVEKETDLEEPCTYLCGNSLGLMPKQTPILVNQEFDAWSRRGVEGHRNHPYNRPWVTVDEQVKEHLANLVGAKPVEVTAMNTLTSNLHSMMTTFFRPTKDRFKIMIEAKAFPSDHYAVSSHLESRGLDPATALITIAPRAGELNLRTQDILDTIEGDKSIALVMLSGVQYYTGQFFDIPKITKFGQEKGCIVGWDLAHAVGNVPLKLHEWQVDFACWCSYKYLNSGAGGIAGLFIHEKYAKDTSRPRLAGWWGNEKENRFDMSPEFRPSEGASGYQQSNPNVLATIALLSSLQIYEQAGGIEALRIKSLKLTGYLEKLLHLVLDAHFKADHIRILTPADPEQRGCQLSLEFPERMMDVFDGLHAYGVICDERKPTVIRLAPVPLYNSFADVYRAVMCLAKVMDQVYSS